MAGHWFILQPDAAGRHQSQKITVGVKCSQTLSWSNGRLRFPAFTRGMKMAGVHPLTDPTRAKNVYQFAFLSAAATMTSSRGRVTVVAIAAILLASASQLADGLGAMSSIAALSSPPLVCSLELGPAQTIACSSANSSLARLSPGQATFLGLGGGDGFFCALRRWTMQPFCWASTQLASGGPRRLSSARYTQISVGASHVCGLRDDNGWADCWRWNSSVAPPPGLPFSDLASGRGFTCGIVAANRTVLCWGRIGDPGNGQFATIAAGGLHACGIFSSRHTATCWGDDSYGQLRLPAGVAFAALALGERHSCGIVAATRQAVCWGDNSVSQAAPPPGQRLDAIVAGDFYTCGVVSGGDNAVVCWGGAFGAVPLRLPLRAPPGPCTARSCDQDSYAATAACGNGFHACLPCTACGDQQVQLRQCGDGNRDRTCGAPGPTPGLASRKRGSRLSRVEIISIALGSTGFLLGLISVACCAWVVVAVRRCRIHHAATANAAVAAVAATPQRRQLRRHLSGTSSVRSQKSLGRADAFTLGELAAATDDFSDDNRIGNGSFGSVYRGVLPDGREVAIKRGTVLSAGATTDALVLKRLEDKELAFQSELEFLTRLHHRHLVTLVGFCAEDDERLLVYDFMPNGTVHDHIHGAVATSPLDSWKTRVKIALQAARGVEYLHTYAVPPIIHRDIKSSNILLDSEWSARVSDFGLSLKGPDEGQSHISMAAAGTVGYMDPEYYRLQQLTTKSDVYSFGVVLLELLTGKRALGQWSLPQPLNLVDFAVPYIVGGEVAAILDPRPPPPDQGELEAVLVVAELAEQCVRLEGKERPTMTEIVSKLTSVWELLVRTDDEETSDRMGYLSDDLSVR